MIEPSQLPAAVSAGVKRREALIASLQLHTERERERYNRGESEWGGGSQTEVQGPTGGRGEGSSEVSRESSWLRLNMSFKNCSFLLFIDKSIIICQFFLMQLGPKTLLRERTVLLHQSYLRGQSEGAGLLERPRPGAEDLDTEVHCKTHKQQISLSPNLKCRRPKARDELSYKTNPP